MSYYRRSIDNFLLCILYGDLWYITQKFHKVYMEFTQFLGKLYNELNNGGYQKIRV